MRRLPALLAGALLVAAPAAAQVTVNQGALDSLAKKEAPSRHRPAPARPRTPTAPQPAAKPQASPPKPAPPSQAKPAIPATPPAMLALPPPVAVPLAHPPPPPTVPLAADAPGTATPIANGLRVTFGPDRAELNPVTEEALRRFARELAGKQGAPVNIYAYAAGSAEDPSIPRRLSLERALAARAVLMQAGIASPRIYPRALGPAGGPVNPDRVDVVTGPPGPPPSGEAG